jgi:hypothetical protein
MRPLPGASLAPSLHGGQHHISATVTPPLAALLADFQSLGDNCEFGLLQRFCGSEPLGLLRFASTPLEGLLAALADGFAQAGRAEDLEIRSDPHGQCRVHIPTYGISYHTFQPAAPPEAAWLNPGSAARLRTEHAKRLRYLKRSLLADLRSGRRLLLRKGAAGEAEAIATLLAALRRNGPSTLLWVTGGAAAGPAGTVAWAGDGLLTGSVGRFARLDDTTGDLDIDVRGWTALCTAAWRLWQGLERRCAVALPPPPCADLLPAAQRAWDDCLNAHDSRVPPPPHPDAAVWCHVLPPAPEGFAGEIGGCRLGDTPDARPGTAHAAIWLPAGFVGSAVAAVIRDRGGVRRIHVDRCRRACWQSVAIPVGGGARAALHVEAAGPACLFTTDWRMEGAAPRSPGDGGFAGLGRVLRPPPPRRPGETVLLHLATSRAATAAGATATGATATGAMATGATATGATATGATATGAMTIGTTAAGATATGATAIGPVGTGVRAIWAPPTGRERFTAPPACGAGAGVVHTVSAWFWIPPDFAGSEVGVFLDGLGSLRVVNARIGRRGVWQRAWAAAILRDAGAIVVPVLHLLAPAGDCVFSTAWRLEAAPVPTEDPTQGAAVP